MPLQSLSRRHCEVSQGRGNLHRIFLTAFTKIASSLWLLAITAGCEGVLLSCLTNCNTCNNIWLVQIWNSNEGRSDEQENLFRDGFIWPPWRVFLEIPFSCP